MGLKNDNVGPFRGASPVILPLVVVLVLLGCAPGAGPTQPAGAASGSAPGAGSKVLRIGTNASEQPLDGIVDTRISVGFSEYAYVFHAGLTAHDAQGKLLPRVAQKVPTINDGDWQTLPDGQMEVTWKLRPNVKWHDGAPLTSADFAFAVKVLQDPEVPLSSVPGMKLISEVVTPDASTLVVRWKQTYIYGNASGAQEFPMLPRHLLGDLYDRGDKQEFVNSPLLRKDFVGLGPYRLTEWVEGSRLEGLAFDDYFLGRPKIDRVIFQYFGDSNVLTVNVLSGAVDLTLFGSFGLAHLSQLKNSWDQTGAGTTFSVPSGTRTYRYQFRNADVPTADVRVRRALAHMLDRQALVDSIMSGLTSPADTVVLPTDPVYRLQEQRGLSRFSFDQNQAQRLMAEAGWTRTSGGPFQSASGQTFMIDLSFSGEPENVKEAEAVAGQWKAAGVEPTFSPIPDAATNKDELRHTWTGVHAINLRDRLNALLPAFISSEIGTTANRYRGANRGGYSNSELDRLNDRIFVTLDDGQRQGLVADFLKVLDDTMIGLHLFYDPGQVTSAVRKGVRGPGPVSTLQLVEAWNIHEWEID